MNDTVSPSEEIADLLVYLGRAARGTESDLTAAQWMAMRFFARANRVSRTPSAFASFHATTRGTASQIIKSLMQKGYLVRHQGLVDRRSVRLVLTSSGKSIMRHDPLRDLSEAIDRLDEGYSAALRRVLPVLAGELAKIRDTVSFGTCGGCRYYSSNGAISYCACVGTELAQTELGRLCINFALREGATVAIPSPNTKKIS